jgi:hypothetical protein
MIYSASMRVPLGALFLIAACTGRVGTTDPSGTGGSGLGTVSAGTGGSGARGVGGNGATGGSTGAPPVAGAGGAMIAGTGGATGRGGFGSAGGAVVVGGGGGASGSIGRGVGAGGAAAEAPPGYVPAILGVGYGGIRIVSRDGGKTWGDRAYTKANGGDDQDLLRAVVYGKGLWIATGWKLLTSSDGSTWIDHGLIADGPIAACNIVEGLAYKDGYFFAACTPWNSPGAVFRSSDGLSWTKYANIGDTQGHLFLTYRGQKFVAYGDGLTSYQSEDALVWTILPGVQEATYCQDMFMSQKTCLDSAWFDGAWLRADWQGKISRSTDGKTFTQAYLDDAMNTLYQSRALATGYVAPR